MYQTRSYQIVRTRNRKHLRPEFIMIDWSFHIPIS